MADRTGESILGGRQPVRTTLGRSSSGGRLVAWSDMWTPLQHSQDSPEVLKKQRKPLYVARVTELMSRCLAALAVWASTHRKSRRGCRATPIRRVIEA